MKYLLGVGLFLAQKYKKNPMIRVSLDSSFLDEFELDINSKQPNFVSNSKYWGGDLSEKNIRFNRSHHHAHGDCVLPTQSPYTNCPKTFLLYELDELSLVHARNLVIDISNDDSNYTNGFMTNSTLVDPRYIFLIPVETLIHFVKNSENFYNNFRSMVPDGYNNKIHIKRDRRIDIGRESKDRYKVFYEVCDGYPFPFKFFWNGKALHQEYLLGGSGKLTVELDKNNQGNISFKTYDTEFVSFYRDHRCSVDGFMISEKFFSIARHESFNKYLHENQ